MTVVPSPRYLDDYADKALDCEYALERGFQELVALAEAEGWSEDDVAAALVSLAHHHLMGLIESRKTQSEIHRIQRPFAETADPQCRPSGHLSGDA